MKKQQGALGVASMIIGIISLLISCTGLGIIGVLGIIMSVIGIAQKDKANGMAITGLVTSILATFVSVIIIWSGDTETINNSNSKAENGTIDGFEIADYEKFNSPADENGLGGTKVLVSGIIDRKYEKGGFLFFILKQEDEKEWLVSVGYDDEEEIELIDGLIGKQANVFGKFLGYSESSDMPNVSLVDSDGSSEDFKKIRIDIKEENGEFKTAWNYYDYVEKAIPKEEKEESSDSQEEKIKEFKDFIIESAKEFEFTEENTNSFFEIAIKTSKEIYKLNNDTATESDIFNPYAIASGYLCRNFSDESDYALAGELSFELIIGVAQNDEEKKKSSLSGLEKLAEKHEMEIKELEESTNSSETTGQKNAVSKAKQYLEFSAFSYNGLIEQLEYEKFSHEESVYGADNCGADWNEQAAKKAKQYLDMSSFSRDGLIEQLEYEGFTNEQAIYGVEQNGY